MPTPRRGRARLVAIALAGPLIAAAAPPLSTASGLPLEGAEAEAFLRQAQVTASEPLEIGITRSRRLTLRLGELTARAIFKTIDEFQPKKRFADGTVEIGFHDSWKNEVAAYELDKLAGFGLVPPVVERTLSGTTGSLQLWVEGARMESDRTEKPVNLESWNRQIFKVRLFHNLTYNTDFNNVRNVLSVGAERIYLVDHSRAFRVRKKLLAPGDLGRFSLRVLARLRNLDRDEVEGRLGRWLSQAQIRGLFARRDQIVALAESRAQERGAEAVYYP